ncbi:hypothetical protein FF38_09556 [Lucilia cuprina]|uniref:Uncharacterized protein n=1 Tax=Lucilia cuprina TaxID=7375 RepID=A0A0L0CCV0_LUCCU|nr:hypothetical protein FF38_09556 [Lucilia cuprina]
MKTHQPLSGCLVVGNWGPTTTGPGTSLGPTTTGPSGTGRPKGKRLGLGFGLATGAGLGAAKAKPNNIAKTTMTYYHGPTTTGPGTSLGPTTTGPSGTGRPKGKRLGLGFGLATGAGLGAAKAKPNNIAKTTMTCNWIYNYFCSRYFVTCRFIVHNRGRYVAWLIKQTSFFIRARMSFFIN